jgi:hypothetical protein
MAFKQRPTGINSALSTNPGVLQPTLDNPVREGILAGPEIKSQHAAQQ